MPKQRLTLTLNLTLNLTLATFLLFLPTLLFLPHFLLHFLLTLPLLRKSLLQQRLNELIHSLNMLIDLALPKLPQRPRVQEQGPFRRELLGLEERVGESVGRVIDVALSL